jgi:hypothetical protein
MNNAFAHLIKFNPLLSVCVCVGLWPILFFLNIGISILGTRMNTDYQD